MRGNTFYTWRETSSKNTLKHQCSCSPVAWEETWFGTWSSSISTLLPQLQHPTKTAHTSSTLLRHTTLHNEKPCGWGGRKSALHLVHPPTHLWYIISMQLWACSRLCSHNDSPFRSLEVGQYFHHHEKRKCIFLSLVTPPTLSLYTQCKGATVFLILLSQLKRYLISKACCRSRPSAFWMVCILTSADVSPLYWQVLM